MNYKQQIAAGMSFLSIVGGAVSVWKGGIYYGKSNLDQYFRKRFLSDPFLFLKLNLVTELSSSMHSLELVTKFSEKDGILRYQESKDQSSTMLEHIQK